MGDEQIDYQPIIGWKNFTDGDEKENWPLNLFIFLLAY
jgi:hypothetical protein